MLSNLPPGVTGFEPEIAGYDEDTQYVMCVCGWDGDADGYWTDQTIFNFDCPGCGDYGWVDISH